MKLTTGYEFQGYMITEYCDVIFDEILVGLGFGKSILSSLDNIFSSLTGSEATEMIERLNSVKRQLRDRVVQKAENLGANALIGIDFESSKLGELIMVSMTATAVKIEKIVSPLPVTEVDERKALEEEQKVKAEEERQRKIDYLKNSNVDLNIEFFIESLNEYESTKAVAERIEELASERPDLISEELLAQVRRRVQLERLYGAGTGKKEVLGLLKSNLLGI